MADLAVHGRPHCVAAVGAGIFKQVTFLLHHPVFVQECKKNLNGVATLHGRFVPYIT